MFEKQKETVELHTERLALLPLTVLYAQDMLKLWNDPNVIRYMNLTVHNRPSECRARIKRLLGANLRGGCPNHFVLMAGEEVIGLAGFPLDREEELSFGFYYLLRKKYWGMGYALEAASRVLAYLFEQYPRATVYADSVADNTASVAILKRLGFQETRREEGGFTKNGMEQDILHFMRVKK